MKSYDARLDRIEEEISPPDEGPLFAWAAEDGSVSGPGAGAARGREVVTVGWDWGGEDTPACPR